jgi:hypothetical protein
MHVVRDTKERVAEAGELVPLRDGSPATLHAMLTAAQRQLIWFF